nr:hypothetical protein [Tanacetum cinerariifolium]
VGIDPVDFSPHALECNPKLFERAVILLDVIGLDMEVKGLELVSTTTVDLLVPIARKIRCLDLEDQRSNEITGPWIFRQWQLESFESIRHNSGY